MLWTISNPAVAPKAVREAAGLLEAAFAEQDQQAYDKALMLLEGIE